MNRSNMVSTTIDLEVTEMAEEYKSRYSIPLQPGTTYVRPKPVVDWVDLDNPAIDVMTDFQVVEPKTVGPEETIDDTLEQMKKQGVRLLLVIDEGEEIIGVITAKDIQGEKPIKIVQETQTSRSELKVKDIMTPQSVISVLNMISVEEAQVGHIVQTLHELKRQHTLIVEVDETSGKQIVRGMFSTSQINKQMHTKAEDDITPADTFAEIVQNVS
ncbi:MAG: CBS domain-containing protein [Arenicellales bacterium]|nr:CBS domain-containing protein [Arenicellales bacterium]